MTWGSLSRRYGLRQSLRRSMGLFDSCATSQQSLLMCVPPTSEHNTKPGTKSGKLNHNKVKALNRPVIFPEDRLMWDYFRKHPEVKQFPYSLNSFEAPFAKRFALQQLDYINSGKTKDEAYDLVAKQMQPEKEALFAQAHGDRSKVSTSYSMLSVVQEEEERQLMEGMKRFRKNNAS